MHARLGTFWPALGAAAAIAVGADAAHAQDASAPEIQWRAPAGCPDGAAVQAEVDALLGRPWRGDDGIAVDAEVSQDVSAGWVLRLRAGDAASERTVPGEGCEALAQAAALMIAWMIDPAAGPSEVAPEPPMAPEESAATELASPRTAVLASRVTLVPPRATRPAASEPTELGVPTLPPPRAEPASGTPVSVGIGGGLVLDVGTLPALTPGFSLEVVVRIDRLDLRVRGGWLSSQGASLVNVMVAAPRGAGVELEHASGSLQACARPLDADADARPGLAICGAVHAGATIARGVGVSHPGRAEAAIAALGVGAAMPWAPFDWLDLEVAIELVVPLGTPSFVLDPFGTVYTPAPVAGRLTLGGHVDVR
jgi:hypothetical protein